MTTSTSQLVALPLDGDGNVILDSLVRLLKNNQGQDVLAHIASFPPDLQQLFDIAHCKARALAQVGRYLDSEEVLRRLIDDAQVDDENRFSAQLTLAKLFVALRCFDETAAASGSRWTGSRPTPRPGCISARSICSSRSPTSRAPRTASPGRCS